MGYKPFFSELRFLNQLVESGEINGTRVSLHVRNEFSSLIKFIEQANWTNSQNAKFICENWNLGYKELTALWNRTHPDNMKTEENFRSQLSQLGKQLYVLLGDDVFNAFIMNDVSQLVYLESVLNVFSKKDTKFNELVIPEMRYFAEGADAGVFDLAECKLEIEAIKTFRLDSVFSYLETLDKEKLSYLKKILNQPVVNTSTRKANKEKIKLIKMIDEIECKSFSQYINVGYSSLEENKLIDTKDYLREEIYKKYGYSLQELDKIVEFYKTEEEICKKYMISHTSEIMKVFEDAGENLQGKGKDDIEKVRRYLVRMNAKDLKNSLVRFTKEGIKTVLNERLNQVNKL